MFFLSARKTSVFMTSMIFFLFNGNFFVEDSFGKKPTNERHNYL